MEDLRGGAAIWPAMWGLGWRDREAGLKAVAVIQARPYGSDGRGDEEVAI